MNRIMTGVLIFSLLLSISGCGRSSDSEPARQVLTIRYRQTLMAQMTQMETHQVMVMNHLRMTTTKIPERSISLTQSS